MDRLAFFLLIVAPTARGLVINTGTNKKLEEAEGTNVRLPCKFTLAPEDVGNLEIEWNVKSVLNPLKKYPFLRYTAGKVYNSLHPTLTGRVYFESAEPANGDAGIQLYGLTKRDTGFYYCQVKKVPGIRSIFTFLGVFEPPSRLSCDYVVQGKNTVLRCRSREGMPPFQYVWSRVPPDQPLSKWALLDKAAGTLTFQDASESDRGTYRCTAINRVGINECFLELKPPCPPPVPTTSASVTAGLVAVPTTAASVTAGLVAVPTTAASVTVGLVAVPTTAASVTVGLVAVTNTSASVTAGLVAVPTIAGFATTGLFTMVILASMAFLLVRQVGCGRYRSETSNETVEDAHPPTPGQIVLGQGTGVMLLD